MSQLYELTSLMKMTLAQVIILLMLKHLHVHPWTVTYHALTFQKTRVGNPSSSLRVLV